MTIGRGRIIRRQGKRAVADTASSTQRDEKPAITGPASASPDSVTQEKLAVLYLALHKSEEAAIERRLERCQAIAVAIAERLLGDALEVAPEKIVTLARQALAEGRGARRIVFEANPLDAAELARHLSEFGMEPDCIDIQVAQERPRGDLCLHTDLGTLDAKLTPQLQRLAAALADAFK